MAPSQWEQPALLAYERDVTERDVAAGTDRTG